MRKRKTTPAISVIVPAYNEEKNIRVVLDSLIATNLFTEIICVNDGSTDRTAGLLGCYKNLIKIIHLRKNRGKGYAISIALEKAKGDIVILIDADIIGITRHHIQRLIFPLLHEHYSAVIGYPYHNTFDDLLRIISGERAYYRKDLVRYCKEMRRKGYGMELFLNNAYKHRKTKYLRLYGIKHDQKYEKQPLDTVVKMITIEGFDLIAEIVRQNNDGLHTMKSYIYPLLNGSSQKVRRKIIQALGRIKNTMVENLQ